MKSRFAFLTAILIFAYVHCSAQTESFWEDGCGASFEMGSPASIISDACDFMGHGYHTIHSVTYAANDIKSEEEWRKYDMPNDTLLTRIIETTDSFRHIFEYDSLFFNQRKEMYKLVNVARFFTKANIFHSAVKRCFTYTDFHAGRSLFRDTLISNYEMNIIDSNGKLKGYCDYIYYPDTLLYTHTLPDTVRDVAPPSIHSKPNYSNDASIYQYRYIKDGLGRTIRQFDLYNGKDTMNITSFKYANDTIYIDVQSIGGRKDGMQLIIWTRSSIYVGKMRTDYSTDEYKDSSGKKERLRWHTDYDAMNRPIKIFCYKDEQVDYRTERFYE